MIMDHCKSADTTKTNTRMMYINASGMKFRSCDCPNVIENDRAHLGIMKPSDDAKNGLKNHSHTKLGTPSSFKLWFRV